MTAVELEEIGKDVNISEQDVERFPLPFLGQTCNSALRFLSTAPAGATVEEVCEALGLRSAPNDAIYILRFRKYVRIVCLSKGRRVYAITSEGLDYLKREEERNK